MNETKSGDELFKYVEVIGGNLETATDRQVSLAENQLGFVFLQAIGIC